MNNTHLRGVALVRRQSSRLAEGIVTLIGRTPVDVDLARAQHDAYTAALGAAGWSVHEVPPADGCPDGVFVEDSVVVSGGTAVLTRSGAPVRRAELAGVEAAVRELGLPVRRIEEPGTLDGGDILQIGQTVYAGRGDRTNAAGIEQLAAHLLPLGRTVVAVPLYGVLHLKSAVTALPDGTVLAWREDQARFDDPAPSLLRVPEEAGAHVVPLGGADVLIASSAPRTAELLAGRGLNPVVVDIGEFERLEGCVTCLSVLIPAPPTL
jgi:dimethylargininase